MRNLAGDSDCDAQIVYELQKAGIGIAHLPEPANQEVPYSVMGIMGNFRFTRAWYYWVVKGRVPLGVARELYACPIGRKDVRVAGHCTCPPPDDWARGREGERVVDLYHIDSQNGLDLFIKVLKSHLLL